MATYQQMLRDSAIGWEAQEPWLLAHLELGRLYEDRGDTTRAMALYQRLAHQWIQGDEDLMALVEVRQRLSALRSPERRSER